MGQRSFIIKVIIGSILIGIAVAANYCQLCRNHVACRPKRGFGARCGNRRSIVPLKVAQQKQILQIHDGLRSLVASGLLKGYAPAKRMGHLQWDAELAKIAALNAKQCYVHYDKCKKTAKFPWVGQNVGIDRANGHYLTTNQSIYRITLKWFRQFELADASVMESYRAAKNPKKRYQNFATMVHDRQTRIGCAAVRFRKNQSYYFYLVCNYSLGALRNRKVYKSGAPYSGCVAGRSRDYPSLCAKNEPIKSVPYSVRRVRIPKVTPTVNPLSFFGIQQSPTNNLQQSQNAILPQSAIQQLLQSGVLPNNFQMPANRLQSPSNGYNMVNLNQHQTGQLSRNQGQINARTRTKPNRRNNRRNVRSPNRNQQRGRRNNRRPQRNGQTKNRSNRRSPKESHRQNQIQPQMFPNPFSFLFG